MGAASHSQALVFMGDFYHLDISWRDNTEEHKEYRRFLECIHAFLLQVIEETPGAHHYKRDMDILQRHHQRDITMVIGIDHFSAERTGTV